ncbi:uncharacterized protein LOC144639076 [Oculina patagonica]
MAISCFAVTFIIVVLTFSPETLRMLVKAVDPNPTQLECVAKIQQLEQKKTQITQEIATLKSGACSSPGTKAHTLIKPVTSQSIASSGPGTGTSHDPYKIASIEDLRKLRGIWRNNTGKYFIVTQNIDLSCIANFAPLPRFEGILDGNNKKILNLKIDVTHLSSQRNTGFFETIGRTGQVKNLRLENVLVKGEEYVGGLAGYHYGRIDNSYVTGQILGTTKYHSVGGLVGMSYIGSKITDSYATAKVSGRNRVGGLVGRLFIGTIQSCYATGTVLGIGNTSNFANWARKIGGLVGDNYGTILSSYATGDVSGQRYIGGLVGLSDSKINNSYATGNVSGSRYIGGLVGNNWGTITKCYAIGKVSGVHGVGGLVGDNVGRIDNSYVTGQVLGAESSVGGLVGTSSLDSRITDSYATAKVSGRNRVGGLVGSLYEGTIQRCYATGTVSGIGDKIGGGLVGDNHGMILSSYATGDVLGQSDIGGLVGKSGWGHQTIINNSYATGNVSGTGITGGLVGYNQGTITKCYAIGQVSGGDSVGGLVGWDSGRIDNSYATGQVLGTEDYIGGLVGLSSNDTRITDSYATAKVYGRYYVGGLVGELRKGTIQRCYATGTVSGIGKTTGTANQIGGLVGGHYGTILSSYATGDVLGRRYIGGLVGFSGSGHHVKINNSYATGNVSGVLYIGGLVGRNQGTITKCYVIGQVSGESGVGGLVGRNSDRIDNSYATGQVLGTKFSVGGLVGTSSSDSRITDSYATAKVSGRSYVGGLVGALYGGTIQRCHATGTVSGIRIYIGGLVGDFTGTILSSYATGNVSGWIYIGGLVGISGGGGGHSGSVKLNNSYATGNVSGKEYIGGLVGYNWGAITKCYAIGNVSGSDRVGGLVGENYNYRYSRIDNSYGKQHYGTTNTLGAKTDTELKTPSTFTGWDTRLWKLTQNQYPKLKIFLN